MSEERAVGFTEFGGPEVLRIVWRTCCPPSERPTAYAAGWC
jgi:hypothetical protein